MTSQGLSVIIPTLNCAEELPAHIDSMNAWIDLASEVFAVDSYSTDGTPDIIRKSVRHPRLQLLNHPRGLYQSWNFAISQTSGRWIYVSTIGDTITRDQIEHMLEAGEFLNADVVVSPPEFVFDSHISMKKPVWPVHEIVDFHNITEPTVIDSLAAYIHAVRSNPNAILGSSASNLYRGDHLRPRPFPTCFRMTGDTGWAIKHALETRFCYTNRVGSVFRFHSDVYSSPDYEVIRQLVEDLREEGIQAANRLLPPNLKLLSDVLMAESILIKRYQQARSDWGLARRSSRIPWYFRPSAIKTLERRNFYRKCITNIDVEMQLDNALRLLPIETLTKKPSETKPFIYQNWLAKCFSSNVDLYKYNKLSLRRKESGVVY